MRKLLFALYGLLSYAGFVGSFLYAVAFVGNCPMVRGLDATPTTWVGQALLVDALLLGLFAVQHSVMARPAFKRWWTRLVPQEAERSTYVLFVSTFLINHFELFGLRQSFAPLLGLRESTPEFRTPGFYRYVRHPISRA